MVDFENLATGPSGVDPPSLAKGLGQLAGEPMYANAAQNLTNAAMKTDGLGAFIEWVVPYEQNREQIGASNFLVAFSQIVLPLLILGLLTRTKDTRFIRRAIFPFLSIICLRGTCAYRWVPVHEKRLNYQLTLTGYMLVLKCIEWGWTKDGRKKLSEIAPNVPKDEKLREQYAKESLPQTILRRLKDVWDLLANLRGINWDFGTGTGLKLPLNHKNEKNKTIWVLHTMYDIFTRYLILDILGSFVHLQRWNPSVATNEGGSLWTPDLPLIPRLILGTALHTGITESVKQFGSIVYDVNSIICVVFLGHETSAWPPLFGNAWASTSFAHYWGTQWHQVLRQTFLICLGYPLGAVFGVLGMVVGTFAASGLLHAWAFYGCGGDIDHTVTWAFIQQGFGLIGERAYYKVTGKKVQGRVGNILVSMGIIFMGQHCTDAWTKQGIAGTLIIPPQASLVQQVVWPWILKIAPALGGK